MGGWINFLVVPRVLPPTRSDTLQTVARNMLMMVLLLLLLPLLVNKNMMMMMMMMMLE